MSAAGSRSSLTFASQQQHNQHPAAQAHNQQSHNQQAQANNPQHAQRPRKRRRKTLSDALQSISLDRDVPQQILKMKEFPFCNNNNNNNDKYGNTNPSGSMDSPNDNAWAFHLHNCSSNYNYNNLNNYRQRLDRQLDLNLHDGGERQQQQQQHGNVYYDDDDNSQLTSSSDEVVNEAIDVEVGVDGDGDGNGDVDDRIVMEDDEENNSEDDSDSLPPSKKESVTTEMEKAQRKVMLELVFGKNHRAARKSAVAAARKRECEDSRIVGAGATPQPNRYPPPLATVSTVTTTRVLFGAPNTNTNISTSTSVPRTVSHGDGDNDNDNNDDDDDDDDRYKDPADRKIEQLLRQSLENLQKGSHPLAISSPSSSSTRTTQDDTVIDPGIYSRSVGMSMTTPMAMAMETPCETPPSCMQMATDNGGSATIIAMAPTGQRFDSNSISNSIPMTASTTFEFRSFPRQRSNSLPGGLDLGIGSGNMLGTTAMETDN